MNFGDLLFTLNCDRLKNEIRKIEKINKLIVQSKNGIYFNEICMCIYIYMHTHIHSVQQNEAYARLNIARQIELMQCNRLARCRTCIAPVYRTESTHL